MDAWTRTYKRKCASQAHAQTHVPARAWTAGGGGVRIVVNMCLFALRHTVHMVKGHKDQKRQHAILEAGRPPSLRMPWTTVSTFERWPAVNLRRVELPWEPQSPKVLSLKLRGKGLRRQRCSQVSCTARKNRRAETPLKCKWAVSFCCSASRFSTVRRRWREQEQGLDRVHMLVSHSLHNEWRKREELPHRLYSIYIPSKKENLFLRCLP